jgi:hypothetical protein
MLGIVKGRMIDDKWRLIFFGAESDIGTGSPAKADANEKCANLPNCHGQTTGDIDDATGMHERTREMQDLKRADSVILAGSSFESIADLRSMDFSPCKSSFR